MATHGRIQARGEGTLSRREAAERLTDIAYALTIAPPLELRVGRHQISVPVPDELLLEGEVTSEGERVRLELELRWPLAASNARPAR